MWILPILIVTKAVLVIWNIATSTEWQLDRDRHRPSGLDEQTNRQRVRDVKLKGCEQCETTVITKITSGPANLIASCDSKVHGRFPFYGILFQNTISRVIAAFVCLCSFSKENSIHSSARRYTVDFWPESSRRRAEMLLISGWGTPVETSSAWRKFMTKTKKWKNCSLHNFLDETRNCEKVLSFH